MELTVTHYLAALSIPLIVATYTKEYSNIRKFLGLIFKKIKDNSHKKPIIPFKSLDIEEMAVVLERMKRHHFGDRTGLIFISVWVIVGNIVFYLLYYQTTSRNYLTILIVMNLAYAYSFYKGYLLIKKNAPLIEKFNKIYLDKLEALKSETAITDFIGWNSRCFKSLNFNYLL